MCREYVLCVWCVCVCVCMLVIGMYGVYGMVICMVCVGSMHCVYGVCMFNVGMYGGVYGVRMGCVWRVLRRSDSSPLFRLPSPPRRRDTICRRSASSEGDWYLSDKERSHTLSSRCAAPLPWPRHRYSLRQHCEVCFASGRLPPVFLPHVISTSASLIFSFLLAAGRPFQIIYGRLFIL